MKKNTIMILLFIVIVLVTSGCDKYKIDASLLVTNEKYEKVVIGSEVEEGTILKYYAVIKNNSADVKSVILDGKECSLSNNTDLFEKLSYDNSEYAIYDCSSYDASKSSKTLKIKYNLLSSATYTHYVSLKKSPELDIETYLTVYTNHDDNKIIIKDSDTVNLNDDLYYMTLINKEKGTPEVKLRNTTDDISCDDYSDLINEYSSLFPTIASKNMEKYYLFSCGPIRPVNKESNIIIQIGKLKKSLTHKVKFSSDNIYKYDKEDYYIINTKEKFKENVSIIREQLGYNGGNNVKYSYGGICDLYARYETKIFTTGHIETKDLWIEDVEEEHCCATAIQSCNERGHSSNYCKSARDDCLKEYYNKDEKKCYFKGMPEGSPREYYKLINKGAYPTFAQLDAFDTKLDMKLSNYGNDDSKLAAAMLYIRDEIMKNHAVKVDVVPVNGSDGGHAVTIVGIKNNRKNATDLVFEDFLAFDNACNPNLDLKLCLTNAKNNRFFMIKLKFMYTLSVINY